MTESLCLLLSRGSIPGPCSQSGDRRNGTEPGGHQSSAGDGRGRAGGNGQCRTDRPHTCDPARSAGSF